VVKRTAVHSVIKPAVGGNDPRSERRGKHQIEAVINWPPITNAVPNGILKQSFRSPKAFLAKNSVTVF
jgi:hypothetical protein